MVSDKVVNSSPSSEKGTQYERERTAVLPKNLSFLLPSCAKPELPVDDRATLSSPEGFQPVSVCTWLCGSADTSGPSARGHWTGSRTHG